MQGAAAGKPAASGGKLCPVQQLLSTYEAVLQHLRASGALVNAVKPEYLLPEALFSKLLEDRSAAAAGSQDLEDEMDYWAAVEAGFGAYSAMAWNTILLQVSQTYQQLISVGPPPCWAGDWAHLQLISFSLEDVHAVTDCCPPPTYADALLSRGTKDH